MNTFFTRPNLIISCVFTVFILSSSVAQAATFTVTKTTDDTPNGCDVSDCSLREAIIAANSNNDNDTIVLGTDTYTLSIPNAVVGVDEDSSATGDLDVNESGHTLEIHGNGFNNTIIDANGLGDRVFELVTNTALDQVAIKNGALSATSAVGGGGIEVNGNNKNIELSNCKISNNTVTVSSNSSVQSFGGGIYVTGSGNEVAISNCVFSENSSIRTGVSGSSASGGGIAVSGTNTIFTLTYSTIANNTASGQAQPAVGGGIYIGSSSGVTKITNTTIANNTATSSSSTSYAGGIYLGSNTAASLAFTTIYANTAATQGGGIMTESTPILNIKNSIVSSNSATTGKNCNKYGGGGTITSGGYNVDYDNTNSASCAFVGTGDTIANPQLSALADNQALYQTAAISSTSAAKDLVPAASCTDYALTPAAVTTDERGMARPEHTNCDAGAYELDQTLPVITITNGTPTTVECKATYTDAGATATDNFDSSVTVLTDGAGGVFTDILGNYAVTYTATDASGNVATPQTRTVSVVDTTAPTITMSGVSSIIQEVGTTYTDLGATATDVCDSSVSVTTTNPVNTAVLGTYTITYNASDDTGNAATAKTRTVTVSDTTKPTLTLTGESSVTVNQGDPYTDAGATATDSFEGTITSRIVTTNPVDTSIPGTYTVTYNVSDTSGNAATAITRTVTVVATTTTTEETPIESVGSEVTATTNGKFIKLLLDGVQVDQLKIGKKKLASKYYKIKTVSFFTEYHNVVVLTTSKHSAKLIVVRVTPDLQFDHLVTKTFAITDRQALKLKTKLSKKRITASVGKHPLTKTIWKLTAQGKLKPQ